MPELELPKINTAQLVGIGDTFVPIEVKNDITRLLGAEDLPDSTMVTLYRYLLVKHPNLNIDDIKDILADKPLNVLLEEAKLFLTTEIDPIELEKKVLEKQMPIIKDMAIETGDWRMYLKHAEKRDKLNADSVDDE